LCPNYGPGKIFPRTSSSQKMAAKNDTSSLLCSAPNIKIIIKIKINTNIVGSDSGNFCGKLAGSTPRNRS